MQNKTKFQIIFNNLYFKCKSKNFIKNYFNFFIKFNIERIIENSDISWYMQLFNNKGFFIDLDYFLFILSKNVEPELQKLIITRLKYNLTKTTSIYKNYNFLLFNEDNYLNIKYHPNFYKTIKIRLFEKNKFVSNDNILLCEEINIRNKNIYFFDILSNIGAIFESKGLYDIKEADIEIIQNYMYLSYILFIILKFFYNQGKKNIIENYQNIKEEQVLNNLLQYINLYYFFGKIIKLYLQLYYSILLNMEE